MWLALGETCSVLPSQTSITADSLSSGNQLLWHKANGDIDTVLSIPAPSTQAAGTFYFYVQQYDTITGCESEMDTAEVIVEALPTVPTTEPIDVCEGSVIQVSPTAVHTLGYDPLSQAYGKLSIAVTLSNSYQCNAP